MITSDQVTVIIPCFNSQGYIGRAMDSVLNQSCMPGKILLVDDSSTDKTLEVLLEIQKSNPQAKIEILRNLQNVGPGFTRNYGWNFSETDWIAFLDSDDAWHPNKIEIQIQVLNEFPDLSLICTQTTFGNPPGNETMSNKNFNLTRLSFERLLFRNTIPTRSVMLRRNIPLRFPTGLSEDYALWLEALYSGMHFGKIEAPLAFHFREEFSSGGLSAALVKHELFELKRLSKYLSSYPVRVTLAIFFSLLKFIRRALIRLVRSF